MAIEQGGFGDYHTFDQNHEYTTVPGVIQTPVASRLPGHRLIRLHGGYGKRTVKWHAERSGRPPVIPSAVDTSGDVLLGTSITPSLPRPNTNASAYDWQISGEYEYAQNTVRVPGTDAFPAGAYPFPVQPAEQVAATLAGQSGGVSPGNFTAFYTALGSAVVDLETGAYIWPYPVLAPVFSSEDLI